MLRIGVVALPGKQRDKILKVAKAMVAGFDGPERVVDFIDLRDDQLRVGILNYLCFVGECGGLFKPQIGSQIQQVLGQAIGLGGKRACVVMLKRRFFSDNALVSFMNAIESQGVILRNSFITSEPPSAKAFAQTVDVQT